MSLLKDYINQKLSVLTTMSETQFYDNICFKYEEVANLPHRYFIELYSLSQHLGKSLKSLNVLDLACGEGFYTRNLKKMGAEKVVGVDISSMMVQIGQSKEDTEKLGIKYLVDDVANLVNKKVENGEFDVVVGGFLLSTAQTKEQLLKFAKAIANNIKEGGKFIGVLDNNTNDPTLFHAGKKYGIFVDATEPLKEGDALPITLKLPNSEESIVLMDIFWTTETYIWAFKEAGFKEAAMRKPLMDPTAPKELKEFLGDIVDKQLLVFFEATK